MIKQKTFIIGAFLVLAFAAGFQDGYAQGPNGRRYGIGISIGDVTAVTFRSWLSKNNSWDAAVGNSYLGSPHIQGGYLWHINDAFRSKVATVYLGVGGVLGFGQKGKAYVINRGKSGWFYKDDKTVVALRGIAGINIIPRRSPVDIFFEVDPLIGISPDFGFGFTASLGIRFYP